MSCICPREIVTASIKVERRDEFGITTARSAVSTAGIPLAREAFLATKSEAERMKAFWAERLEALAAEVTR